MEDLFFSEQILKRIGAKTPETTWISVKEFFEASEKGGQTLVFLISKKTKESGILDTDRLFLRFGRGSLKNIREGDVVRNPIVMAFMNLPALFANAIVARLKKSIGPISKLLSFSEKEKQDSNISVKQMESEMNALQSIVKENSETISKLS